MDQKDCVMCGEIFYKKSNCSKKRWENQLFCGRKCQSKSSAKKAAAIHKGNPKSIEVRAKISAALKGRPSNSGSFQKGTPSLRKGKKFPEKSGQNNAAWKQKTLKPCEWCGVTMELHDYEKDRRRFCSMKCRSMVYRGPNSPVYKGDERSSYRRLRMRIQELPEYKEWRSAVYKRDNYTCQECGKRGSTFLHAHHIKLLSEMVRENGVISPKDARKCEELWDISNGKTLCKMCHRTLHSVLGKSD